jgi:hypothetical protein
VRQPSLSFPVRVRFHPSALVRRSFNEGGFIPHPFPCGWLVSTNLNNVLKKTIIKLAAEVAGLTSGKDVIVEF